MTDIVERLRATIHEPTTQKNIMRVVPASPVMLEAADEIERLRHENAEMRRTFGSYPLCVEKDAEIRRLRDAAFNVVNHRGLTGIEEWIEDLRTALRHK